VAGKQVLKKKNRLFHTLYGIVIIRSGWKFEESPKAMKKEEAL
jgi:hypothetical protein